MTQVVDSPTKAAPPTGAGETAARGGHVVHLNAFQVLMRRWSKLHPYNAGQVMRVSGIPDRERWKQAVETVIAEVGLGRPRFQSGGVLGEQSVKFLPLEEITIDQSERDLETFFNEELNRAFVSGDLPIRFCILPAPSDGEPTHYLAAVYDHWIADSRAMRELMQRIFDRYQHPRRKSPLPPMTIVAPAFKSLFRRHTGRFTRWVALKESIKNIWHHRKAYRLNLWDPLNFQSRFLLHEMPTGLIDRLRRFAKAHGASVNDLFIGAIGQTMGAYTAGDRLGRPAKPLHFTRQRLGVGTIVDIRDAANEPLDRVFNLYLSSYTVLMDNPEQRSLNEVTQEVAQETSRIKRTLGTIKGYWAFACARLSYDLYDSPRYQALLLHKTVPVVAGISNVNMTDSWVNPTRPETGSNGAADVPQILDYIRISPTGPLIPLVFTLTTIGDRLSLCVTYRTQAFHEGKLREIVSDFIRRLSEIGQCDAVAVEANGEPARI